MKSRFERIADEASREVETMAVWRSLGVRDREKALQLLLGRHWKSLYKATIERYQNYLGRI